MNLLALLASLLASFWLAPELLAMGYLSTAAVVLFLPRQPARADGATGEVKVVWDRRPPVSWRVLSVALVLATVGLLFLAAWRDVFLSIRYGTSVRYVLATLFAISMMVAARLSPRRFHLTDRGVWSASANLLETLAGRGLGRCRVVWSEVEGFAVQADRAILHRPARGWLGSISRRTVEVQLVLPDQDSNPALRAQAIAHLRACCPGREISVADPVEVVGTGRYRRWSPVLLAWALVMLVANAPYVWAALHPPPGKTFVGFHAYVPDMLNYVSYAQQAEDLSLSFRNKLVPEPHAASYVNLEWLVVGGLSRVLGRRPALAYRIFGLAVGLLLVVMVDRTFRRAGLPASHRFPALLLALTGSGLGGVAYLLFSVPLAKCLDQYAALFPVLEILYNPHAVAGTVLMLLNIELFARAKDWRSAGPAILFGTVHALIRPYDLGVVVAIRVLTIVALEDPLQWWRRALPLAGLAPALLYNAWVFVANPAFSVFSHPRYAMPIPQRFLLALVPATLLAFAALLLARPQPRSREARTALVVWMVFGALTVLAPPVDYALQFLVGIGLPCLMLAGVGFARFGTWATWLLVLCMSSSGAVAVWRTFAEPEAASFANNERMQAALALREPCRAGGRLLAPADIGLYAAALTGCSPFVSHFSVAGHDEREAVANAFFTTFDAAQRAALLARHGITHVAFPGAVTSLLAESPGERPQFRLLEVIGAGPSAVSLFAR